MIAAIVVCLLLASSAARGQQSGKPSHTFTGKVQRVDTTAKTITVDGNAVEGWMAKMIMTYRVDRPDVLNQIRPGDNISATVYDGDVSTLYGVRVASNTASATATLPDISYACPSVGEEAYIDDKPGRCPTSGVPLIPVRLVTAYSCLRFQAYIRETPGVCPVDRAELVPITAALYFTCEKDRAIKELNPGRCADGSARIRTWERRPHGDHNPRHGGSLFMATDQFHHLEGTFVAPGLFRVFVYDDMTRPLAVDGLSGQVSRADSNGHEIGTPIPVSVKNADNSTLEARIADVTFPLHLTLRLKFRADGKEQLFDFTFLAYSKEP
jgi:Cu/Ag efflux protein CusF